MPFTQFSAVGIAYMTVKLTNGSCLQALSSVGASAALLYWKPVYNVTAFLTQMELPLNGLLQFLQSSTPHFLSLKRAENSKLVHIFFFFMKILVVGTLTMSLFAECSGTNPLYLTAV